MDNKLENLNGVPIPSGAPISDLLANIAEAGPTKWAAIRALAEKPDVEALAALAELTRSKDAHVRRSSVEAIGIHPLGHTQGEIICHLLQDCEAVVVRTAIDVASKLRCRPAHSRIIDLVNSSDESTRVSALRALESLWQASDFETAMDRFLHDQSEAVRKQAAWTLHATVSGEHWEQLFSVWSKDALARHRVWACQLAGRFGNRTVRPALEILQSDQDGHVRNAARQAADRVSVA